MIQYISYADLNEFYSIKEVCRLLEMDKENLRKSCEKYPPACAARSSIFLRSSDMFKHPPHLNILKTVSRRLHQPE